MTPKNVKLFLSDALSIDDSVLIQGLHGIGKSSIVKQAALENNMHYELLILSIKEPGDLLGMPSSKQTEYSSKTVWDEPDWFQRITNAAFPEVVKTCDLVFLDDELKQYFFSKVKTEKISRNEINSLYKEYYDLLEDELYLVKKNSKLVYSKAKQSLLFLDELNRANQETRQVALQLVLEKELHSHKLPYVNGKRTFIVSAINPSDKYQVFELDMALLDRFTTIEMVVDVESFLEYAKQNDFAQEVIDFISEFGDRLHVLNEDESKGPTPRSWEVTSDYIKSNKDKSRLFNAFEGRLGSAVGLQFFTYYNEYQNNITLESLEKLISTVKNKGFEDVVNFVKEKCENLETIRKKEIFNQSIFKYKDELKNKSFAVGISPLIFMYAFEVEVTYFVLKSLRANTEDEKLYYGMVELDKLMNNKKFFNNIAKIHLNLSTKD